MEEDRIGSQSNMTPQHCHIVCLVRFPQTQTPTVTGFSTKTTAKEDYLVTDEDLKALSFISVGQRNDPPSFFPSILRAHHLSTPMLETRANVEATD